MCWRQQIAAGLCAAFLLAGIVAFAIKAVAFDVGSGKLKLANEDRSGSQPTFASNKNTTSRAKAAPRRLLPFPQLEIVSPGDVGSLWEDGPAFDLSHEGVDY
jgi:hypothetical protein